MSDLYSEELDRQAGGLAASTKQTRRLNARWLAPTSSAIRNSAACPGS